MSTEFTLEDVLNFLDNEEQNGEFTNDNVAAKFEKEKISEIQSNLSEEESEKTQVTTEEESTEEETKVTAETEEEEETSEETDIPKEYYNFLEKNNILAVDEDFKFDGSVESLETALLKTKENLAVQAVNAIWNRLTPEFQAALKYNLDGGTDFSKFAETYGKPSDLSKYDLKKIEDQKAIVAQYYKATSNYNDERINKFINKLIETEDLYDEAEEAVEYLKKHEETKKEKLLQEVEQQQLQKEQAQKEWRETISGNIKDSTIPDTRKSKVQAYLLNPVKRGDVVTTDFERTITALFSNPQHYVQLADLLYNAYDPKKGLDLAQIVDKTKTQAASKFQQELEDALKTTGRTKGGTPQVPSKNLKLDWESILDQLDN